MLKVYYLIKIRLQNHLACHVVIIFNFRLYGFVCRYTVKDHVMSLRIAGKGKLVYEQRMNKRKYY